MEDGFLEGEDTEDYAPPIVHHFDYLFKIILIGDSGVGKTCVLTRFKERELSQGIVEVTGGIVFKHVVFQVDSKIIKLQIWDSAGQERFRCVTQIHYKNKDAFLLFYDVTDRHSFESIRTWLEGVEEITENKAVIFLIANKCDNDYQREVSREDGETLASNFKVPYLETSAVTGLNVDLIFEVSARTLMARKSGNEIPYNSIFV